MGNLARAWKAKTRQGDRDPAVFEHNYKVWLQTVGAVFKKGGKKGEKAKWLGVDMVSTLAHAREPPS